MRVSNMKKGIVITLLVLAAIILVWSVRFFSFTGSYIAWFESIEPLGGGSYVMQIHPDGTGTVGSSPESSRLFTYRRAGNKLEILVDWDSSGTVIYVFDIKHLKLVSLGRKLPDGSLTNESGYGFMMRGIYYKQPL